MAKEKYVVFFVQNVNGLMNVVAKKKVKEGVREIDFRKKSYILHFDKLAFRRKGVCFFLVELGGVQIATSNVDSKVSPELIDTITRQHMGVQIIRGLQTSIGMAWLQILIGLGMGIPIGFIIELIAKVGM